MHLNNKYKLLILGTFLLIAQITFAQAPFGSPINSGGRVTSGGTISTGSTTTSGGTTNAGGTTQSGGTLKGTGGTTQSGGATRSGGSTSAGGMQNSGGMIYSGGSVMTGGRAVTGGSVQSGGSLGRVCVEYEQIEVSVKDDDNETFHWEFQDNLNNCIRWSAAVTPIRSGGVIGTTNNPFSAEVFNQMYPGYAPGNLTDLVNLFIGIIKILIPIIGAASLWIFFWGLGRFIKNSGDEKAITEGKDLMIWGIVGLFVMVSVYGLVNLLYGSVFGGAISGLPLLPTR